MCDAVELVCLVVRSDVEALVDIRVECLVAETRLAKGGHAGVPATSFEVETSERCHGAAEGMSHENQFVVWILFESLCDEREDYFAGVEPGRVEASVDSAVFALWGVCWWRSFTLAIIVQEGPGPRGEEV